MCVIKAFWYVIILFCIPFIRTLCICWKVTQNAGWGCPCSLFAQRAWNGRAALLLSVRKILLRDFRADGYQWNLCWRQHQQLSGDIPLCWPTLRKAKCLAQQQLRLKQECCQCLKEIVDQVAFHMLTVKQHYICFVLLSCGNVSLWEAGNFSCEKQKSWPSSKTIPRTERLILFAFPLSPPAVQLVPPYGVLGLVSNMWSPRLGICPSLSIILI